MSWILTTCIAEWNEKNLAPHTLQLTQTSKQFFPHFHLLFGNWDCIFGEHAWVFQFLLSQFPRTSAFHMPKSRKTGKIFTLAQSLVKQIWLQNKAENHFFWFLKVEKQNFEPPLRNQHRKITRHPVRAGRGKGRAVGRRRSRARGRQARARCISVKAIFLTHLTKSTHLAADRRFSKIKAVDGIEDGSAIHPPLLVNSILKIVGNHNRLDPFLQSTIRGVAIICQFGDQDRVVVLREIERRRRRQQ